ncbi:hypothetical protein JW721_05380 [Candidatus Micrarchaeota archaeon]|nr:hypothetical protein [Candidatus Micrarchaeota archaeon]
MAYSKVIALNNLQLNTENYRFEAVASQKEAMDKIMDNQKVKLYNLARDIAENGLSPIDKIQVSKCDYNPSMYKVLEGNRRITSLKLILNPEMIDN